MTYNNSESPFMQRKEELLSRINEVKTILDKMKKRGRCFSFNTPVKFGKARVDEVVLQLMKDCTAFVNDVNKIRQLRMSWLSLTIWRSEVADLHVSAMRPKPWKVIKMS